jgi:hypothetical protein
VTAGKPYAVCLRCNLLVVIYDIDGRDEEGLYYYFVPSITLDNIIYYSINSAWYPGQYRSDSISNAYPKNIVASNA